MEDVIPKYEVLYSDLKNHFIGRYLVSRNFKLFMSEIGEYEKWKRIYDAVENSSFSYRAYRKQDNSAHTFRSYLNVIPQNPEIEDLVTLIIEHFISDSIEKKDFSDVVQSMTISDFKSKNIDKIKKAFENHKKKEFPEERVIPKKQAKSKPNSKNVFIVHGHNEEIKHNVARTLTNLKLNPIILHEQSNEGLTVIKNLRSLVK